MDSGPKIRASRNRTLILEEAEHRHYSTRVGPLTRSLSAAEISGRTVHQSMLEAIPFLPDQCVDLLFLDPPYNLTKDFRTLHFKETTSAAYQAWIESWIEPLLPKLKSTASVYLCGDWKSSAALQAVVEKYFRLRNRITWEREKGRGALANWKNCSEDIWFGTVSDEFHFDAKAVQLRRRVIAPYRENGQPKDWEATADGQFRQTSPSNLWTDLTVPFWSMPENTDHPTQKPEKLLAKILLASSRPGDLILDPFLGSGTTSVVAKKLGRQYLGIEVDLEFCCLAEKRLAQAESDRTIQGYAKGVFWERNSSPRTGNEGRPSDHSPDLQRPNQQSWF